jgi:hypothetical protein
MGSDMFKVHRESAVLQTEEADILGGDVGLRFFSDFSH